MDYAVFQSGGKQYRVRTGDVIDVEKLPVELGARIDLDQVLAVSRDGNLVLGQPLVANARVVADVQGQVRDSKIIVFKYKPKTRYRRKNGHRQAYTRLAIRHVLLEGEEPEDNESMMPASSMGAISEVEENADEVVVGEPEPDTEEKDMRPGSDTAVAEESVG